MHSISLSPCRAQAQARRVTCLLEPFRSLMLCKHTRRSKPSKTHFEVLFPIWTTGSLLLFLIYSTIVPEHTTSHFWWLARTVRYLLLPPALFTAIWAIVVVIRIAEGLYATTPTRSTKVTSSSPSTVRKLMGYESLHESENIESRNGTQVVPRERV
jgi:hypothetical protein